MTLMNRRMVSVLLVLLLGAQMVHIGLQNRTERVEIQTERPLVLWYTDEEIRSYVEDSAEAFASRYGVEMRTELVSDVDYIENISARSMAEEMSGPDVYVVSSALLEKAALSGLTTQVEDEGLARTYSEKAVQAVTYDGRVEARPFYIETCFLLYNRYYAEEAPDTIEGILNYAENFEADQVTERVENIFKWNVDDVTSNYTFMGAYTDLGGPSGDDKSRVSMDLDAVGACMAYYQSLNSFFAIDADTVTSEEVVQEFIDGKTVFALANVPMLHAVEQAGQEGALPEYASERTVTNEEGEEEVIPLDYDPFYGISTLPELTEELDSRGISVTNSVVVNPYSFNREAAGAFARYLTVENEGMLYEKAGKLPASRQKVEDMPERYQTVYEAYEEAAEVPKIMELSNLWLHVEVVLADIWRGDDAQSRLLEFSELLGTQLDSVE